jgi:hypothetical protein
VDEIVSVAVLPLKNRKYDRRVRTAASIPDRTRWFDTVHQVDCSSPFTEAVPPWSTESDHGSPPSVNCLPGSFAEFIPHLRELTGSFTGSIKNYNCSYSRTSKTLPIGRITMM